MGTGTAVAVPRAECGGAPQLDDFVGAHPDYNEEEEEHKYFRRKCLGIVKNVVAASLAGTLTYGAYLGTALSPSWGHPCRGMGGSGWGVTARGHPQASCRCS